MFPLLAQVSLDVNDLVAVVGITGVLILLAALAMFLLIRSESKKVSAIADDIKADADEKKLTAQTQHEQQSLVTKMVVSTSEQVGTMQTDLMEMTKQLGEANVQIAVLTEREKNREELWNERFDNLTQTLNLQAKTINERDRTIASMRRERDALISQREDLLLRNNTLVEKLDKLSEKVSELEIKLAIYDEASRKISTQEMKALPMDENAVDPNTPTPDEAKALLDDLNVEDSYATNLVIPVDDATDNNTDHENELEKETL
jgi:septal ring factor EnvC (AmiA/AmiB activator)